MVVSLSLDKKQKTTKNNHNTHSGCGYYFFFAKDDSPDFQCPKCNKRWCLHCRVDYHVSTTCTEYQKWSIANGMADDKFEAFVTGRNFKACPRCQAWVEKTMGCDHITCRCGYEFCYRCGGRYHPGRPCSAEDLSRARHIRKAMPRNNRRRTVASLDDIDDDSYSDDSDEYDSDL